MFRKILLAIDNFDGSRSAFNKAVSLAKALDAKLMLLHVLSVDEEGSPEMPIYYSYTQLDELLRKKYEQEWNKFVKHNLDLLQQLTEEAQIAGVDAEFNQVSGNPGRTICDVARLWEADLIMTGSHGRSGLGELFLGSVSNYVTHHAPCSVMVTHPQERTESHSVQAQPAESASV